MQKRRAKFYDEAINAIYKQPKKQFFFMDGPVGMGKTSQFIIAGWYDYVSHINPVKIGNRLVRSSSSLALRYSMPQAAASVKESLQAFFGQEGYQNCVKYKGGNSETSFFVTHALPDGTILEAKLECKGYANYKQDSAVRSVGYDVVLLIEVQKMPSDIITAAIARAGRNFPDGKYVEKEIDGKMYRLSGAENLSVVLADGNIERRPHYLYDQVYDREDLEDSNYLRMRPPSPILPVPVKKAKPQWLNKGYPETIFEGKRVVWVPNKSAYEFTQHYEESDEDGKPIKFSGYGYWFKQVHSEDDRVRRDILGKESRLNSKATVYRNFDRETHVKSMALDFYSKTIYLGWDPGRNSSWVFIYPYKENSKSSLSVHLFKNFTFADSDNMSSEQMFEQIVFPYIDDNFVNCKVIIVADPYAFAKHHSSQESGIAQIERVAAMKNKINHKNYITVEKCKVANQNTDARIEYLGYFIDQHLLSVDPNLGTMITGLSGGYSRKVTASGEITDDIDKLSKFSHNVESAQYPIVNIYLQYVNPVKNRSNQKDIGVKQR